MKMSKTTDRSIWGFDSRWSEQSGADMADSKEKTRRHWRVLRAALLSKRQESESSSATASAISTEFFPMFAAAPVCEDTHPLVRIGRPAADNFAWVAYDLALPSDKEQEPLSITSTPNGAVLPSKRVVYVHEKAKRASKKVSVAELLSHQVNQGVDNTGNIRTWPSEQILLWHMLRSGIGEQIQQSVRGNSSSLTTPINCCELGSGMAGLASLGLLAHSTFAIGQMLVTDGNPRAVDNLKITLEENRRQGTLPKATEIVAELVRWDRNALLPERWRNQFHLVFASDCLFFEEFHDDLVHTIKQLLEPRTGKCLLLQPSRNGSMERFCAKAQAAGLQVDVSDSFDAEISRRHLEYQQTRSDYVPDVHCPRLVIVSLQCR